MNNIYLIFITLIFTFLGSLAAIQLKKASDTKAIIEIIRQPSLYYGAILYVVAAVLNIIVLFYWDYTVVLPLTSITYVWTALLARFIFKEELNFAKLIGLIFILIGSIIVV